MISMNGVQLFWIRRGHMKLSDSLRYAMRIHRVHLILLICVYFYFCLKNYSNLIIHMSMLTLYLGKASGRFLSTHG